MRESSGGGRTRNRLPWSWNRTRRGEIINSSQQDPGTEQRERKLTYLRQLWGKDEQECGKVDAKVDGFIVCVMCGEQEPVPIDSERSELVG